MLFVCVATQGTIDAPSHQNDPLNWGDGVGALSTLGDVIFAFGFTGSLLHAYAAADPVNKAPTVFSTITLTTAAVGISMCLLIGLVGYLSYRNATSVDILENFTGPVGIAFKVIVIAHLVLYIPGDFVVMRASLLNVACRCRVHDLAVGTYVAATVALLGTVTAAAVLIQVRPWSYLFVARCPLTPCTRRSTRRATKACR